MTRDEFVEKFKVGDVIETTNLSSITVLHIGNERFFGRWGKSSCEVSVSFSSDWKKVSTPKLPSEEINQIRMADTIDAYAVPYSPAEKAIIVWLDKNWPNVQMKGEK